MFIVEWGLPFEMWLAHCWGVGFGSGIHQSMGFGSAGQALYEIVWHTLGHWH
jgi:hypothetical protein